MHDELMRRQADGDIVVGCGQIHDQAAAVAQLMVRWDGGEGPTPNNVICWTPQSWIAVVLARERHAQVRPLQAIETVNRLVDTTHPTGDQRFNEIRLLATVGTLHFCLATKDYDYNSEPLPQLVCSCWNENMILYHEMAAKLVQHKHPEWACAIYARALTHLPDLIYDQATLDAIEMAALLSGDASVPYHKMTATQFLAAVKHQAALSRPLPSIARRYRALMCSVVRPPELDRLRSEAPVSRPGLTFGKRARIHLDGIRLAEAMQGLLPEPDADIAFFKAASRQLVLTYWNKRLSRQERTELDDFYLDIAGARFSAVAGLTLDDFSQQV